MQKCESYGIFCAATAAKSLQLCPTLCDPIDGSPPGSSIPGILQARILEWVAISSPVMKVKSEIKVAQLCPTHSDPMDRSTRLLHPWDFPGKSTGVGCELLILLRVLPSFWNGCGASGLQATGHFLHNLFDWPDFIAVVEHADVLCMFR